MENAPEGMVHHMKKGFGVKRAFGEPIEVKPNITIIPVARVNMGGGGGKAMGPEEPGQEGLDEQGKKPMQKGSGFGFGGKVEPIGYIRIKDSCVKWVPIHNWKKKLMPLIPISMIALAVLKKKKMAHMHMQGMGYGHHAPWPAMKMMKMHHRMHGDDSGCPGHCHHGSMGGHHHGPHAHKHMMK